MAHFKTYQELDIYKLARDINRDVWTLIQDTSLAKDFKLRDQINGSSGSIMDNIAEGFGRGGNKEFINFLSYSRGSCFETEAQLQRAYDRNHISEDTFKAISLKTQDLSDQISKFITYLKSTDRRGSKFD